jgi:hypothetical protein
VYFQQQLACPMKIETFDHDIPIIFLCGMFFVDRVTDFTSSYVYHRACTISLQDRSKDTHDIYA